MISFSRQRSHRHAGAGGYVVVYIAIVMTKLIGFASLALDYGRVHPDLPAFRRRIRITAGNANSDRVVGSGTTLSR